MAFRIFFRTFADMNEIHLEYVTPDVFADRGNLGSDVWQQDLTLERGKTYLVEAASGTGKSSLCSFSCFHTWDFVPTKQISVSI